MAVSRCCRIALIANGIGFTILGSIFLILGLNNLSGYCQRYYGYRDTVENIDYWKHVIKTRFTHYGHIVRGRRYQSPYTYV